ncbi:MAG TPA: hypothetical protein VGP79_09015 [Bryobacteraceae bacterium]|jgi:hypothetical protein|nr:hypothetical protein [Bryobacteraceae bacterium]
MPKGIRQPPEDNMKAKLSIVLVTCVALFLSACGSSPQRLILGKWEAEGAIKLTAEFSGDGTAKITMLGQTLQGRYKLDAGNELEWTLNGRTTKSKVNVTATELEMTNEAQQTIKYKRSAQ